LRNNTTGAYNVAVGVNALSINTVGTRNVAIGHSALYANTGTANTALGFYSLRQNTIMLPLDSML